MIYRVVISRCRKLRLSVLPMMDGRIHIAAHSLVRHQQHTIATIFIFIFEKHWIFLGWKFVDINSFFVKTILHLLDSFDAMTIDNKKPLDISMAWSSALNNIYLLTNYYYTKKYKFLTWLLLIYVYNLRKFNFFNKADDPGLNWGCRRGWDRLGTSKIFIIPTV